MTVSRRLILLAGPWIAGTMTLPLAAGPAAAASDADSRVRVVKDAGCACCGGWIAHLRDNGFDVTSEDRSAADLAAFKRERGIPDALSSCHTATVGDYTIEGHVPAADIRRLLAERPAATGLSVPGMRIGSPGMGPESEREAYDVVLIGTDGQATVFTAYPAA